MVICSYWLLHAFIPYWKRQELGSRGNQGANEFPVTLSSLNLSCLCNVISRQAGQVLKPGAQGKGVPHSVDMGLQGKDI